MKKLLLYRESVGGRENGAQKEGVIGDGAGAQYLKDVRLRRRRRGGRGVHHLPAHIFIFLAGNKKSWIFDPTNAERTLPTQIY